jgi:hypothetical protein
MRTDRYAGRIFLDAAGGEAESALDPARGGRHRAIQHSWTQPQPRLAVQHQQRNLHAMLTLDDVSAIFGDLAVERGCSISPEIAVDVHTRTDGHPGLVAVCGKALDEELLDGQGEVTLAGWLKFVLLLELNKRLLRWSTMLKMVEMICGRTPLTNETAVQARKARKFLHTYMLPTFGEVEVTDEATKPLADFLTAEGALTEVRECVFAVRCKLIRSLHMLHVVPHDSHRWCRSLSGSTAFSLTFSEC